MLIKYIKSVLWRVGKRLSYIQDARCLKVKESKLQLYSITLSVLGLDVNRNFLFMKSGRLVLHCLLFFNAVTGGDEGCAEVLTLSFLSILKLLLLKSF